MNDRVGGGVAGLKSTNDPMLDALGMAAEREGFTCGFFWRFPATRFGDPYQ
jgi:hypothetical protein